MSRSMFQGQTQKPAPACGYCGRTLNSGFFYLCHTCGSTYCYAHSPKKCDHKQVRLAPVGAVPARG